MKHHDTVKKIIKKLFILTLLVIVVLPFLSQSTLASGSDSSVHLEIDFVGNLLFNKYDVDLFLDGEDIASLSHGKDYSGTFSLAMGRHELSFRKSTDHSICVDGSFTVSSKEVTVSGQISTDKKKINLTNFKIIDDAAEKAKQAREKAAAERKAKEERERKELAEITKKLCAVQPDDDISINDLLKQLNGKVISFTGHVAYISFSNNTTIVLIRNGQAENKETSGPDFQIICNNVAELPYSSDVDLDFVKGLDLKIESTIDGYDNDANIIALQPVKLSSRGSKITETKTIDPTSKEAVLAIQTALNNAGYDCGTPDGKAGKRTYTAIKNYRKTHNLGENTVIDEELIEYLRVRSTIEKSLLLGAATAPAATSSTVKKHPTYIGHYKSKVFHKPSCYHVDSMNEENKVYFYGTRQEVIDAGYRRCSHCKP